jgi:hypothetical protein
MIELHCRHAQSIESSSVFHGRVPQKVGFIDKEELVTVNEL